MSYQQKITEKFTANRTVTSKPTVKPLLASSTWKGERYQTQTTAQISETDKMVRIALNLSFKKIGSLFSQNKLITITRINQVFPATFLHQQLACNCLELSDQLCTCLQGHAKATAIAV